MGSANCVNQDEKRFLVMTFAGPRRKFSKVNLFKIAHFFDAIGTSKTLRDGNIFIESVNVKLNQILLN